MPSQIQCLNCGSYKTIVNEFKENENQSYVAAALSGIFKGLTDWSSNSIYFDSANVKRFQQGKIGAICQECHYKFDVHTINQVSKSSTSSKDNIEKRLTQLDKLRKKNLITEEEYKLKREELLRSL
jgi:hypothetical protein